MMRSRFHLSCAATVTLREREKAIGDLRSRPHGHQRLSDVNEIARRCADHVNSGRATRGHEFGHVGVGLEFPLCPAYSPSVPSEPLAPSMSKRRRRTSSMRSS